MNIKKSDILLKPDITRVLLVPFELTDKNRVQRIINYVYSLSEPSVLKEVEEVRSEFNDRHRNFTDKCFARFEVIKESFEVDEKLSENKRILLGSYFLKEYSVECAALFNPSIVFHPDQSNLNNGEFRFVLSLRATGEGHISSIVFRIGIIDSDHNIKFEERSEYISAPNRVLIEGLNYEVIYNSEINLSERIIFPLTPDESNGIEDARFVKFSGLDSDTYFATYTAYDGKNIVSKILQTNEFTQFQVKTLKGSKSKNKGMALFPKKINGKYAMLSRQDGESNFIMYSDDLYNWNSKELLTIPEHSWEFVQMGNCGSPIETEKGWLVLTHGVGPVRKYSISAILLDLNDPTKVIGRLRKPFLTATGIEREGYVPNVVYSCGGIIHNNKLVLPYAVSDSATSFAIVDLEQLLSELINNH